MKVVSTPTGLPAVADAQARGEGLILSIRAARDELLEVDDPDWLSQQAARADMLRSMAAAAKMSSEVALEATRYEIVCLWRMAALVDLPSPLPEKNRKRLGVTSHQVLHMRDLQGLTLEEVTVILDVLLPQSPRSANACRGYWKWIEKAMRDDFAEAEEAALPSRQPPTKTRRMSLDKAVRTVLDEVMSSGEEFTVRDAATALAARAFPGGVDKESARAAYVVTQDALNRCDSHVAGVRISINVPRTIAIKRDSGWKRKRLESATLEELEWYIDFRAHQLSELSSSIEDLYKFRDYVQGALPYRERNRGKSRVIADILTRGSR